MCNPIDGVGGGEYGEKVGGGERERVRVKEQLFLVSKLTDLLDAIDFLS